MIHLPKNSFTVPFLAGTYAAGDTAGNVSLCLLNLDSGLEWKWATSTWGISSQADGVSHGTTRLITANWAGGFMQAGLNLADLPRGHYSAKVVSSTGDEYGYDFSVGLYTRLGLGYSAVYSTGAPNMVNLSLWLEENGILAVDPHAIKNVVVYDRTGAGTPIATLVDNTTNSGGVFSWSSAVNLTENTNFIIACEVKCPGVQAGQTNNINTEKWSFLFRLGIARP